MKKILLVTTALLTALNSTAAKSDDINITTDRHIISTGVKVDANGHITDYGNVENGVHLQNSGDINITAGTITAETLGSAIGHLGNGNINVQGTAIINGKGPENIDEFGNTIVHTGNGHINIKGGQINLDNSSIYKVGGCENGYGGACPDGGENVSGNINFSGGKHEFKNDSQIYGINDINISGGNIALNNSYISAWNDLNISGGTITATNTTTDDEPLLFAQEDINVSGGTIDLTGTELQSWNGKVNITDGNIKLTGTSNMEAGIWSPAGDLDISGKNTVINMKGNTFIDSLDDRLDDNDQPILETPQKNNLTISEATINVSGTNNTIGAAKDITLSEGTLNLAQNSVLEVRDEQKLKALKTSNSHLNFKGRLKGNIQDDGTSTLVLSNTTADVSGTVADLGNLTIDGISKTIGTPKFIVSDNNKKMHYIDGTFSGEPMKYIYSGPDNFATTSFTDITSQGAFANQILGTMTVQDGANVTLAKEFSADKVVVDNATLTAKDTLAVKFQNNDEKDTTSAVSLKNNAVMTIDTARNDGGVLYNMIKGFDINHSTLNVNTSLFTIVGYSGQGIIKARNNSILNFNADGMNLEGFDVANSTINADNTWVDYGTTGNTQNSFVNSKIIANNSTFFDHAAFFTDEKVEQSSLINGTSIKATNSVLGFGKALLNNGTSISLSGASKAGTLTLSVLKDGDSICVNAPYDEDANQIKIYSPRTQNISLADSTMTLRDSSEFNNELTIEDDTSAAEYKNHVTKDMLSDTYLNTLVNDYGFSGGYPFQTVAESKDAMRALALVEGDINIAHSTVDMYGTSSINNYLLNAGENSGNVNITDGSTVNVHGNNTISAANEVRLYESTLNVDKNATLNVLSGMATDEEGNVLSARNATINVYGKLNAEVLKFSDDDNTHINMFGGQVTGELINVGELILDNGKTSQTLGNDVSYKNLKNLTVSDGKNAVLDTALFHATTPRTYTEDRHGIYDEATLLGGYIPDKIIKTDNYSNQIAETLTVDGRSTLTLQKDLAADKVVVDNHSKLVANQALLSAGDMTIDNGSTVIFEKGTGKAKNSSISGEVEDTGLGFALTSGKTVVDNGSKLVSNQGLYSGITEISNHSRLEYSSDFDSWQFSAVDSTIIGNQGSSRNKWNDLMTSTTLFDNSTVDFNQTWMYSDGNTTIKNNSKVDLKNSSTIAGNNMSIDGATIVADNSYIGAYKQAAIKIDQNISSDIRDGLWLNEDCDIEGGNDLDISHANITLKGSSALGNAMAVMENKKGNAVIGSLITKANMNNIDARAKNYAGEINISDSTINLNDKSVLENGMLKQAVDSGNINIDHSVLNINGKNTISAGHKINITDSDFVVSQNSALTVYSDTAYNQSGKQLNLDNVNLALNGTINGNVSGSVNELILGKRGKINGTVNWEVANFGVSGMASGTIGKLLQTWGENSSVENFKLTNKSSLTYDSKMHDIAFENLDLDASTLTVARDMDIGELKATNNSTVTLKGTSILDVSDFDIENSNLKIIGVGVKNANPDKTQLRADNGININNSGNTKAVVDIKNAAISGDAVIADTTKTTLNTVLLNNSLTLSTDDITTDKKGNPLKTANLNGIHGTDLNINNVKVTSTNLTGFYDGTNVSGIGQFDIKGAHVGNINLSDSAKASLATQKSLVGSVELNDNSSFELNGTITGDVLGEGSLIVKNAKAKVQGEVSGVRLVLVKLKGNLSKWFNSVSSLSETQLDAATITADADGFDDFGALSMTKSKLTLSQNMSADSLKMDGSSLNLGTHTLTVAGTADLTKNKNSLFLNVNSADEYGQLAADTIKLGKDTMNKPTTSLNVTLRKGVNNLADTQFKFLDYENIEGELGSVKIANNRYKFTETDVGQFSVSAGANGKGVVERYVAPKMALYAAPARNLMRTAAATVDNPNAQDSLSVKLDALSQQVGGEKSYVSALMAMNPDDSGMILTNTLNIVDDVSSAISTRLSSSSLSAMEGMSSGDDINDGAVWTKMLYSHAKLSESSEYAGFKANNQGLAMGADKHFSKAVKAGIGYAYTDGSIKSDLRHNDVNTHTAFVYGEYKPSSWFINGSMSYGWSNYDTKAYSILGVINSEFSLEALSSNIASGYEFKIGKNTFITPSAGMRYINLAQNSYRDSDGKKVSASHSDMITAITGIKAEKTFQISDSLLLKPEAYLGLSYDIANDANSSVVSLSNGAIYSVEGRALSRSGTEVALGLTAQIGDNWELSAGYEAKFRDDFQNHTGELSIRYNF